MHKENIPGWLLMLAIGLASVFLSKIVVIEGKYPIEPVVFAIVLGIIIRNVVNLPAKFHAGIANFEKVLIFGIVLIGASLNFKNIGSQSANIIFIILITMLFGFSIIYILGKVFKLPTSLAILLSVGTTICGGVAIAVTAPIIKAKEEHVSYSIGVIALWGLIALLFYPKIAHMFAVPDVNFGIFAGTAIHSTPQVVGAGFMYSDSAGITATAVKLIRNLFIFPVAFFLAIFYSRKRNSLLNKKPNKNRVSFAKGFPWFLFGYFVLAALGTQGYFSPEGITAFSNAGKFLILLGLAGVGLNSDFASVKKVGVKPIMLGFLGSAIVAFCSIGLISFFL